jgi:hypothetical protein
MLEIHQRLNRGIVGTSKEIKVTLPPPTPFEDNFGILQMLSILTL